MLRQGNTIARYWHMGVDLGQRKNHSAIVLVEQRVEATGAVCPFTYEPVCKRVLVIRHVEQVALGTRYSAVVEKIGRLSRRQELGAAKLTVAVDATGLGGVVAEMLRAEPPRGELMPVVFTSGELAHRKDGIDFVPKTELMMGLMRSFEVEGLCVARGVRHWGKLEEELLGMRRVAGPRQIEWVSEGKHDDLVMALAVALFGYRLRALPVKGAALARLARG
jgi:hypothetical protein